MLAQIVILVLGTGCDLLAMAFLARFALQWARAPFRNPLGQFIIAITDWAVRPLRKLVPGLFGLDLASLLLAWLVQCVYVSLVIGVTGMFATASTTAFGVALLAALVETLRLGVYLAMGIVIVGALLSWINPYAPMAPVVNLLARPLLRPAQRLIPPIGGVDLSPLLVLLALQVLLVVLGYGRVALMPFVGP